MPKTVEYIGENVEISDYLAEHYFVNQTNWASKTVPLNPTLREDFDETPNGERDDLEVEHWWDKPFIVTCEYWQADKSYKDFFFRMKSYDENYKVESENDWLKRMEESKASWLSAWPSGVRYEVRCLNGGAWDRSSSVAMVATLAEALKIATPENIPTYPIGF